LHFYRNENSCHNWGKIALCETFLGLSLRLGWAFGQLDVWPVINPHQNKLVAKTVIKPNANRVNCVLTSVIKKVNLSDDGSPDKTMKVRVCSTGERSVP